MVFCLERGADLHTAQLMPLPLTSLASVKSRLVLLFWYRLTQVVPEKGPLNGCVCVCYEVGVRLRSLCRTIKVWVCIVRVNFNAIQVRS